MIVGVSNVFWFCLLGSIVTCVLMIGALVWGEDKNRLRDTVIVLIGVCFVVGMFFLFGTVYGRQEIIECPNTSKHCW